MIAKISRGGRFGGLMGYLAGDGRENEHTDPHLVAGDPSLVALYGDGQLDRGDALDVAQELDRARRLSGTEVTGQVSRWDQDAERMVSAGRGPAHVWHCSLSLHPDEPALSDEQWSGVTHDFMARMGFDDPQDPRVPAQWVAVRHGLSTGGNDHVHIVASAIRPDGTKVNLHNDYKRASVAVADIERAHGLRVVEGRSAEFTPNERSYTQAEDLHQRAQRGAAGAQGRDVRDPRSLSRHDVHRRVRAAVEASADEAEFVRRMRVSGLAVRPFFAKGTHEVVTGYSVTLKGQDGHGTGLWHAGGKIAKDLSLSALRASGRWPSTPESATEAAAEWRHAKRGLRTVTSTGRETQRPVEQDWRDWYAQTDELLAELANGDGNRHVWTRAAREAAGGLSAWSVRAEDGPGGPLGNAARVLSRSAWLTERHGDNPHSPAGPGAAVGAAAILLAAGGHGRKRQLDALLLAQIVRLSQAVHDVHVAAGRGQEADSIAAAVRTDLAAVRAGLPKVRTLGKYDDPVTMMEPDVRAPRPQPDRIPGPEQYRTTHRERSAQEQSRDQGVGR